MQQRAVENYNVTADKAEEALADANKVSKDERKLCENVKTVHCGLRRMRRC